MLVATLLAAHLFIIAGTAVSFLLPLYKVSIVNQFFPLFNDALVTY